MTWRQWVLLAALVLGLARSWWLIDRQVSPKTTTQAVLDSVEASFYIWLVITW